ncbi:MAG: DNA polymerase III subunit alpha [Clostridiales bacterium]|jgi:DNA polymerase-3 subunit alpha|nr:DNA polymerase III subunit alpha [Clostridiales bacterium]
MSDDAKQFVHLHTHTQYSLLDGAARIDKIFEMCDADSMPAAAITDHGNMYGVFAFVKQAVKHTDPAADFSAFMQERRPFKVKPVIGCELYVDKDMSVKQSVSGRMPKFNHLILLAKNEKGYHNLIKLSSLAFTEGLYYKPRVDLPLLERYKDGLICLSACLAGHIPQACLRGDLEEADRYVKYFKGLFGDDFYIEIQDHKIADQRRVLPRLVELANNNGVKLVATNDVHYPQKSDALMQKVLQCISFRTTISYDDETRGGDDDGGADFYTDGDGGYFPTKEFYFKTRAEMDAVFPTLTAAVDNTLEVAEKCEPPYYFVKKNLLPMFDPSGKTDPLEKLRALTYEGLERKYKTVTDKIRARADYELSIIAQTSFEDYFLIVWDFIRFAESRGISVGPGRGSGVGSIVAYALNITKIDPLKYELFFERFLNPERVSSPDFDIDFCVERRGEVIDYVVEKYGADNVSQIVTFGTLAAKAAVKDVGRVFNQPYSEVERITKLIPFMMGKKHIGDLLGRGANPRDAVPDLKAMYEGDLTVRNIIDMAAKIEGLPRQTGMHAAGVIICRDPIFEHIPMSKSTDDAVTTQFDKEECEQLGLLKMDFLGLRTLTDIRKALDIIKVTRGVDVDFYDMEYDDPKVFELIGEGDTHAVFQLESEGMKRFMRDLKPTRFEDIIAGIALYRPGPMDKIPDYVAGKRNPDKIVYDHPLIEPILNVTYGVMVYQEQVMDITRAVAGYTLGGADEMRRIMSKKKPELMRAERKKFIHGDESKGIPGAVKNGIPENLASKVFDDMESFASYAFNKSHAAAYAYLAYQTAYLKKYYTVEFIAAVLNNRITSIDEIRNYLSYLKERGIGVLPPDINASRAEFTVENGAVRIGMAAIKNVGAAVMEEIVAERERNGPYADFVQFVRRLDKNPPNKKQLESLIVAGTFDCFGRKRAQLMQVYDMVLDRVNKDRKAKLEGQFSFFDLDGMRDLDAFTYPDAEEFSPDQKLRLEKDVAGVYLSGHPLDGYVEYLKRFKYDSRAFTSAAADPEAAPDEEFAAEGALAPGLSDGMTVTIGGMLTDAQRRLTKTGKDLALGKIEDLYGSVEVAASGYALNKAKDVWKNDKLVTVTGKIRSRDGVFSIWVDKIEEWQTAENSGAAPPQKICFYMSFSKSDPSVMDSIRSVLQAYPGANKAYVKDTDANALYDLSLNVEISDYMLNELYGIVGEGNIKIIA